MKRIFQCLMAIAIVALMIACDANRIFDEYKQINDSNWNKDSLVVFTIPITDTIQNYNMFINVRNDINYNFSNLWLFINIIQPNGTFVSDTFEIALAEPSGEWLGEGFGGVKKREIMYRGNVYFPVSGDYSISIQQGMREKDLRGVTDVGVRIEKAK